MDTRLRKAAPLNMHESSAILDLLRTWKAVLALFDGNEVAVKQWLASPILALGNEQPLAIMNTSQGRELVRQIAIALDSGSYV